MDQGSDRKLEHHRTQGMDQRNISDGKGVFQFHNITAIKSQGYFMRHGANMTKTQTSIVIMITTSSQQTMSSVNNVYQIIFKQTEELFST